MCVSVPELQGERGTKGGRVEIKRRKGGRERGKEGERKGEER